MREEHGNDGLAFVASGRCGCWERAGFPPDADGRGSTHVSQVSGSGAAGCCGGTSSDNGTPPALSGEASTVSLLYHQVLTVLCPQRHCSITDLAVLNLPGDSAVPPNSQC